MAGERNSRRVVKVSDAEPVRPFSPGVISGGHLFVSGQASVDAAGNIVPGSFEEEMRRSMERLTEVLEAAGCGLGDVVQVRTYVEDPADLPRFNELYREYFEAPWPARTTLTSCLGPIRFEIDAVAALPESAAEAR